MSKTFTNVSRQKCSGYEIDIRSIYTGKPHTLLLIHGIGVSGRYFHKFAQISAHKYNVVILDLPGYGKTPKPSRPLTIQQLASVVAEYVRMSELPSVTVVGQSMGCQIVAYAMHMDANLFRGAVLIGATVNKRERTLAWQGWRLLQDTLHEPFNVNTIIFRDYIRMGIGRYVKTAMYMIHAPIEKVLPAITCPVLFVRGEKDVIAPTKWIDYLGSITPHARTATIMAAPHVVQFTNPQELLSVCTDFIENS